MAKDAQEVVRDVLMSALSGSGKSSKSGRGGSGGALPVGGLALGAGAALLIPAALKKLGGLGGLGKAAGSGVGGLGKAVGSGLGEKVTGAVDDAGGPSGILGDTVKRALPIGGDDDDG